MWDRNLLPTPPYFHPEETMLLSVTAALRKALQQLEAERQRLDRQIAAIRAILDESRDRRGRAPRGAGPLPNTKRRRMSVAARRAISQRMKAYWAKRRAAMGKVREKSAQKRA
jgi:hypothetical protein